MHAGHEVVNIRRGQRSSYIDDPIWQHLRHVTADRAVEDHEGTFPSRVAGLQPDVVIDLICFTLDSATALVERLRGYAQIAASWFGQNAVLRSVTWDEFRRSTNDEAAQSSWDHLVRNHYFSIDKACTLLGYTPQYQQKTQYWSRCAGSSTMNNSTSPTR